MACNRLVLGYRVALQAHTGPLGTTVKDAPGDAIGCKAKGKTLRRTQDVGKYIAERTTVDANGCWNWKLAKNNRGYGMCLRRDWRGYAHRFAYTVFVGEIPEGAQIDHLCMNKACVNPEHLEPVSAKVNTQRERVARLGRNHSIFQRGDGMWQATVEVSTTEGKRDRKFFRGKSREVAMTKLETWLSANR